MAKYYSPPARQLVAPPSPRDGFDGRVDTAMRGATDSMGDWLAMDYSFTPTEIATSA